MIPRIPRDFPDEPKTGPMDAQEASKMRLGDPKRPIDATENIRNTKTLWNNGFVDKKPPYKNSEKPAKSLWNHGLSFFFFLAFFKSIVFQRFSHVFAPNAHF